jgi:metal-responsive CopG/Arc/MetJ family transcriptional regulator
MLTQPTHDFHISLPDELYNKLLAEAERSKQPAAELAQQAIDIWLQQRQKEELHEEIAAYAAEFAGTEFDLDEELEAASIEHLLAEEEESS